MSAYRTQVHLDAPLDDVGRWYAHLLDGGLGDASFLGAAVMGNPWATEAPKTAAKVERVNPPIDALESEIEDQPQTAATA
jgi:hypothetical protein